MTFGNKTLAEQYDIVIMGGGLAGLSLARQLLLADANRSILILEHRQHPVAEAAHKVGESLVEIGAHYFYSRLALADHLNTAQLKKAGLRFFFPHGNNRDISQRIELGATFFPKTPSFQLDRGRFENYLATLIQTQGAHFFDSARVLTIDISQTESSKHTISFSWQKTRHTVQARWLIDATGRASKLKRQLGLTSRVNHNVNAAWFRVKGKIDLDTWSDQPDWLTLVPRHFRYLSTNHLMGAGHWVWLIPLASGCTSIGIVADPQIHSFNDINQQQEALAWLTRYEPQLAHALSANDVTIIDFHALKHVSHGCQQVYSAQRWAITGEAGVFLDPFYSPGSDFIAISNDFISALINTDLQRKSIVMAAAIYNQQYLALFHAFMPVYQDQYALMGHAGIMTHKVLWDYAVYWGMIGLLYFNKKYTDISFMQSIGDTMHKLTELNIRVQQILRDNITDPHAFPVEKFIDTLSFDFLYEWNSSLTQPLPDDLLRKKLSSNLAYLQSIADNLNSKATLKENMTIASQENQLLFRDEGLRCCD